MKKTMLGCALGAFLLASCGEPDSFKIEVDAPGIGTQLMTVVYTVPSGDRRVLSLPAVDGKFSFEGESDTPSLIEIFASNKSPFAVLIAANGDEVKLSVSEDGTRIIEGSELSHRLNELSANYSDSTDYSAEPQVIADALKSIYGTSSRTDMLLFMSPELFIREDSTMRPDAAGIWVFTAADQERTTALLDTLRSYHKRKRPVRDVWVGTDTLQWRAVTRTDSARWLQGMLPDAPLLLSGILRNTPALVEVDTAGNVLRVHNFE